MATKNNDGGLKHRVTLRFSDKDMEYLRFMAEEMEIDLSVFIRDTVRGDLIDEYRRMIRFYPPTKEINDKVNELATKTGLTRQQVLTNIAIYHFIVVDVEVLTEELLAFMLGSVTHSDEADQQKEEGQEQQQRPPSSGSS